MENKYRRMMEESRQSGGLLDALHAAQKEDGYVTEAAMREAAAVFGMTPAAVYDAASFYTMLSLAPRCAHEIRICGSAACHVDGSDAIRKAVEDYLGIRIWNQMILAGTLWQHLADVDRICYERMDTLMEGMKWTRGITEELKSRDQLRWVAEMNNAHAAAEEIVIQEVVYA